MRIAAFLLLLCGVAFAQVENAADAAAGVLAGNSVVPGSLAFINYVTPVLASGATVSIRPLGSSTAIPAEVVNVTTSGVTFLVPPDAPPGSAQLIYSEAGQNTVSISVSIVSSDLALYRTGTPGPLTALNVNVDGSTTPIGLATPGQPGQTIKVLGTGMSYIPQFPPEIILGGVAQSVVFAGNAAGQPGNVELEFQIAPGTPDGCYVPLSVTWGTSTVNSFLSKTSDGMPCHHPFQLSSATLATLDNGGTIETGLISVTTALTAASSTRSSRSEQATVSFPDLSTSDIATYFAASPPPGCGINPESNPSFFGFGSGIPIENTVTLQSASTTLTLSLQGIGFSASIPPSGDAPLSNLPAPVFASGAWTLHSSLGSFTFNLSAPLQIGGGAPVVVQSGQSQTIAWNGSGFDAGATLQISLVSRSGPASLTCFAPAQAGSLTIPANQLSQFTPGGIGVFAASATESGAAIPYANFTLPGGTPLLMLVIHDSTDTRPADFQ